MGKLYTTSIAQCCFIYLLMCMLVWPLASTKSEKHKRICQSISIRNSVKNLKILENCTVIEGYLKILLMDRSSVKDFENVSFPNLVEIRDYMMLYRVRGLQSIGKLFPNLAVIRGAKLFINYALIVYELVDLKDIGVVKLNDILRGSVRIEKNPNLCYISTVNWDIIARSGKDGHFIKVNKDPSECHDICPHQNEKSLCPESGNQDGVNLCWNRYNCQKVCSRNCTKKGQTCAQRNRCCHPQCLGGCHGSEATDCVACRNVNYEGKCLESCPSSWFQFNSRCLTQKECRDLSNADPRISYKSWKVQGKARSGQCTLSCPHGYMAKGKHGCLKCEKACPKVCRGGKVDNLATAQDFDGCTAINGSLTIQLGATGSSIYQELDKFLGNIETIDGYLKVIHSAPLISLNFLRNLTLIKGNELDRGVTAIAVRENENLMELWDWPRRRSKLTIRKGRPFFHYNPKLCLNKINHTMEVVGMKNMTGIEVSQSSNGNKGACDKKNMELDVDKIYSTRAVLVFDNFRKLHYDARKILSFVISHRQVGPNEKVSLYEGRDACSNGDWKVQDYDISDVSDVDDKVMWTLQDLVPDTRYAAHVRTSVIDMERQSGFSKIIYFKTHPSNPTSPVDLILTHVSEHALELKWMPPLKPNGVVTQYFVFWVQERDVIDDVRQHNFCEDLPITFAAKSKWKPQVEEIPTLKLNKTTLNNNTCVCPKRKKLLEIDVKEQIYFENYIQNSAYVKRPVNKPRSKRSIEEKFSKNNISASAPAISLSTASTTPSVQKQFAIVEGRTQFYIKNLLHFTKYHIKVKACHNFDHAINDTRCSVAVDVYRRTKPKPDGDDIDIETVQAKVDNHTSGLVHIIWSEPLEPNGLIDGYQVEYKRIDIQNFKPITVCITKKKFEADKGHSLLGLQPGKYSMRLQAISLAGKGSWTGYKYFQIKEEKGSVLTSTVIAIIFFSIVVFILFIVLIVWKVLKRRYKAKLESSNLLTSVNPEYTEYVPDEWEMLRKNIEIGQALGQGTFGMVYEGVALDSKTGNKFRCAIKTVNQKSSAKEFLKEATVMKGFACHHVVKLKGIVSIDTPTLVIMELMENGDLRNFLRSQREDYVPQENQHPGRSPPAPNQFVHMAAEIADGMDYLSSRKFVHRDLAARNCMVAKDMTVKIGDFGMTRDIYETDYYRKGGKGMLPVRWMAPESLKDGVYTSRSDVWSYGVVLWEMVTLACQPYPGLSNEEVFNYIVSGGIMEKPLNCDEKLYNIMMSCWQINPLLRPSFNELVKCFLLGVHKNFRKHAFHFRCQNPSDTEDSDEADVLDPASPLRNSPQNKDELKNKNNFIRRLFHHHKSRKQKSLSPVKNHQSTLPSVNENQLPSSENHQTENHKPEDPTTTSAISNKKANHSNGFVLNENTASTCC